MCSSSVHDATAQIPEPIRKCKREAATSMTSARVHDLMSEYKKDGLRIKHSNAESRIVKRKVTKSYDYIA